MRYARTVRERFYVYVVELRSQRLGDRTREVYVGSSALPPPLRFAKHLSGETKASRHVRRRGVRLLPALYDHLNRTPITDRERIKVLEQRLADDLTRRGYRVYGSCKPTDPSCWL